MKIESAERIKDVARLTSRLDEISENLTKTNTQLNEWIDDLDVKHSGQRAGGALLVACGSTLMVIGGLM